MGAAGRWGVLTVGATTAVLLAGCLSAPAPAPTPTTADAGEPIDPDAGVLGYRGLTSGEGDTICLIRSDNRLLCAGDNTRGQLGIDAPSPATTIDPLLVVSPQTFVAVDVGLDHACAIDDEQALWCWGSDDRGQLGNGSLSGDRYAPTLVSLPGPATAVAAGAGFTCAAVGDGAVGGDPAAVYCWGENDVGQLGDQGVGLSRQAPTEALLIGKTVDWLVASVGHACALTGSGTAWCWGESGAGEIDQISHAGPTTLPPTVVAIGATALAASDWNTSYLDLAGDVLTAGIDAQGQHGDGPSTETPSFSYAILPGTTVELAAAALHHCARNDDGRVSCWGNNTSGQLSTAGAVSEPALTPIDAMPEIEATAIGVTRTATCAVGVDDSVTCWGAMADATGQWSWTLPADD